MSVFRRAHERAQGSLAPPEDPGDRPEALRAAVADLVREVNRDSGRLPVEAVVVARRVLDVLRELAETAAGRELDMRAVIAIRGLVEDYLPTTLRAYLALEPDTVDVPRPSGRTPACSLVEQLDVLWGSATDLLAAVHASDADALMAQGSFLQAKFTGSDLDL